MCRVLLTFFVAIAFSASAFGQRLSPLAPSPKWEELEGFQETISMQEFKGLLDEVYAPNGAAAGMIDVNPEEALILKQSGGTEHFQLRFSKAGAKKAPPRYWRPIDSFTATSSEKPLEGIRIALDPGHLGGEWARMEERWFQLDQGAPVTEGDMTLRVAQLLRPKLEALGAEISFVRQEAGPTTPDRPETLKDAARADLALRGITTPRENYEGPNDSGRGDTVQFESELLFFRTSEIRHRAQIVNDTVRPDFVICLHFNAEAWGNPDQPDFVPRNHLHVLLNGCYSAAELQNDDVRFDMLVKLLDGAYREELMISDAVATSLAKEAKLPPYIYTRDTARRVSDNPYLWARNLLANRLYRCPVIYVEPYVMNCREVWERVQAGDYEGEREIAGAKRKSIYREYADGVVTGIAQICSATRPRH